MINRRGLPLGFFLLTLAIISGALWAGKRGAFTGVGTPKKPGADHVVHLCGHGAPEDSARMARQTSRVAGYFRFHSGHIYVCGSQPAPGWTSRIQGTLLFGGDQGTMSILVIGLNHSTAPVEVRERITFPGDSEGKVTRFFADLKGVEEAMILSTCNRAEVITSADDAEARQELLIQAIGEVHGLDPGPFRNSST